MRKDPILHAKKFGRTMFFAFLFLGGLLIWWGRSFGFFFLGLALFFLFFSELFPAILIPIERGWMKTAHALGWINTRILLLILFFAVLTPIRFFLWIFKKDLLDERINPSQASYWVVREPKAFHSNQYERLY